MKLSLIAIALLTVLAFSGGFKVLKNVPAPENLKVEFVNYEADKKVDILVDGKLFTSYCWYDNVHKPVLYPVITSAGTVITRGFPLKMREGERNDHPHQVGIWLNYGNVNGVDFWGNGSAGFGSKNANGGEIKHQAIERMKGGTGEGVLAVQANWLDPSGKVLLAEKTEYHFIGKGSIRIIDRITTLNATNGKIVFDDTKEGMFGIRVARQLELPSKDKMALTDAQGNITNVKAMTNIGVSGNFISSEGITGESVWSTRAKWMDLFGTIGDEKISLVVCDHPKNLSYPTYWHARGYGLFAANPLGTRDFTKGAKELKFSLANGQSVTFRYRVIVNSGSHLTQAEVNAFADDFANKY